MANPIYTPEDFSGQADVEQAILELSSTSNPQERRRQLVIELEGRELDEGQAEKLLPALYQFIEAYRDSDDPNDLVAVGSAIRTYVARIPADKIGTVSRLLEAGHRMSVSVDLELEIAKMTYRKFEANPPEEPDVEPELADQLAELGRLYLTPRLLPRSPYGSIAMNTCLALAAMLSSRAPGLLELAAESPVGWFRHQLRRRLNRLAQHWAGNDQAMRRLQELTRELNASSS